MQKWQSIEKKYFLLFYLIILTYTTKHLFKNFQSASIYYNGSLIGKGKKSLGGGGGPTI